MTSTIPRVNAKVAVVIPAYCAGRDLADVLRGIPDMVTWIVVVDDASPDDTAAIASRMAQHDSRICLVRHRANQGVGGAVLSGYRRAHELGADVVVKMDADGQMDPAWLPNLVAPILRGEADYVKGNRFLHARQLRSMPWLRRIGNLGLSLLTKLASGYWNLFDPTNGYTAIHARLLPLVCDAAIARRYFFETSVLLELSLLRAVVRDVYIPARYCNETSHLSVSKSLCEFPRSLVTGFLRRLWIQYFVRDFGIASVYLVTGATLFAAGSLFGGYHWAMGVASNMATPTGTVMLAVLPIILGVQLLLQAASLDVQNLPERPLHQDLADQDSLYGVLSGRDPMPDAGQDAAEDHLIMHRRIA